MITRSCATIAIARMQIGFENSLHFAGGAAENKVCRDAVLHAAKLWITWQLVPPLRWPVAAVVPGTAVAAAAVAASAAAAASCGRTAKTRAHPARWSSPAKTTASLPSLSLSSASPTRGTCITWCAHPSASDEPLREASTILCTSRSLHPNGRCGTWEWAQLVQEHLHCRRTCADVCSSRAWDDGLSAFRPRDQHALLGGGGQAAHKRHETFDSKEFIEYLRYLLYWKRPECVRRLPPSSLL